MKDEQFYALSVDAAKACRDIYMGVHVSDLAGKPEYLKQAWVVGGDIYAAAKATKAGQATIVEDNAFDDWFDTGGYDAGHYDMFEVVWTAARAFEGAK